MEYYINIDLYIYLCFYIFLMECEIENKMEMVG